MELEIERFRKAKSQASPNSSVRTASRRQERSCTYFEIANAYVNDVNDYLKVGDAVKVKILSVNEAGKINLSIKQAQPSAPRPAYTPRPAQPAANAPRPAYTTRPANTYRSAPSHGGEVAPPTGDTSFEDKLKQFMQQSDSKINDSKIYADRRSGGRRRK